MATFNANPIGEDWRALWLVRSRILHTNLGFWLILLGYNPRKYKFENPLYTLYALLFFALWIFMVLILLADTAGGLLLLLPYPTPQTAAVAVGIVSLLAALMLSLWRASRRSPFVFDEVDAQLLCQTPLSRQLVALAWFVEAWLWRALGVWAAATVLGYALEEALYPGELTAADLPRYLWSGLRVVLVALLIYLFLEALVWAVGAWRLRGDQTRPELRWLVPGVGLVLAAGFVLLRQALPLDLWPFSWMLRAGLGGAALPAALGAAAVLAGLGLLALWRAARGMSLARAAQETNGREVPPGTLLAAPELAPGMEGARSGRAPSRLPVMIGLKAVTRRSLVQSTRRVPVGQVLAWLILVGLVVGLLRVTGWGAQIWLVGLWLLFTAQVAAGALRRDLSRWWLLRSLPFDSDDLLLANLALPVAGVWLLGLVGLLALGLPSVPYVAVFSLVYFTGAVGAALGGAVDVLRQSKTQRLLTGYVPGLTIIGFLLGALTVVLPGGLAWLALSSWNGSEGFAVGLAAAAGVLVDGVLWLWAADQLRRIG